MLKVLIPQAEVTPLLIRTRDHSLPFELEPENFRLVTSVENADVIPVMAHDTPEKFKEIVNYLGNFDRNKCVLIMMHTHIQDTDFHDKNTQYLVDDWFKYSDNIEIITLDSNTKKNLFYDFNWNRQKAYFVDYNEYDLSFRLWTGHATKKMFELPDIVRHGPYKKILLPNRVHSNRGNEPRNVLRQKLHDLITDRYCHRGHPEQGYVLYPQENTKTMFNSVADSLGGWAPISSDYYETSFVSVYVETISVAKNTKCVTEKTFDPLIKGHFILPFGYKGLIEDIKTYGFILPNWIDYSYDSLLDTEERFSAYTESINKIIKLSDYELTDLYEEDRWMLVHNRNLFFTRPYDSLYKKIKKKFNFND